VVAVRRRRALIPTVLALAAAAASVATGCGRERIAAPDVARPAPPGQFNPVVRPAVGLRFQLPGTWQPQEGRAPLVLTATSGTATIALWRYPRTEPLPDDAAALRAARRRLAEAARIRDRTVKVVSSRSTRVDGARAVTLVADQTVAGRPRRVRSTHVYAKGAEVVLDTYAAPRDFPFADRAAFRPVLRSLKIDPPAA